MKKVFISLAIIPSVFGILLFMPDIANAAGGGSGSIVPCETIGANQTSGLKFLAFPAWYRGLTCNPSSGGIELAPNQEIGPLVFTIALNIIDIALRLIGILAVGFVLWGGFRYVMARGEPEKAKNALDTIIKAVIGLVIAIAATAMVSFIVWGLSRTRRAFRIVQQAQCPVLKMS